MFELLNYGGSFMYVILTFSISALVLICERTVEGIVSAPLMRKVRFNGGGIRRAAVAKVINEHRDEISNTHLAAPKAKRWCCNYFKLICI